MQKNEYGNALVRVDALLEDIRVRQHKADEPQDIDAVCLGDFRLKDALRQIARERQLSDHDAVAVQHEIDEQIEREYREQRHQWTLCGATSDAVHLYKVRNLAGNDIDVIAASPVFAKTLAARVGHVHLQDNATAYRYRKDDVGRLQRVSHALAQALKSGVPGVVQKRGNYVLVRGMSDNLFGRHGEIK